MATVLVGERREILDSATKSYDSREGISHYEEAEPMDYTDAGFIWHIGSSHWSTIN